MFQLVYASSALRPFSEPELRTLLRKARQNNVKLGVTGMLLYKGGNFLQALEGEQEVVTTLLTSIESDPRHRGVLVLLRRTSEQRDFPDWSMGFRNLANQDAGNMPGYSDFMNTSLTGAELSQDPNRCMKLLLLFKKNM
jgi:hypothetical protein